MAILVGVLLLVGAIWSVIAAIGIVRMPDLFMRMQTATKASTMGIGCLMLAAGFHFGDLGIFSRAVLVVAFLALTAPVSAHLIARAGYFTGSVLWKRTKVDELEGSYDPETHDLGAVARSGPIVRRGSS